MPGGNMAAGDNPILAFSRQAIAAAPEFKLGEAEIDGVRYPVFENAPPSLAALYAHAAGLYGDAELIVHDERRISFTEADRLSRAAADAMRRHGIGPGDAVAIAMRTAKS